MADGEVLINTKINTDGAKEDLKKLKKELKEGTKAASESAGKMDKAFEDVDASKVADGLSESVKEEAQKAEKTVDELAAELPETVKDAYSRIQAIRENDSTDQKTKAAQIAGEYKKLGQTSSDAMKNAWAAVKADSATGSRKVIDNLEDIAKEAEDAGDAVTGKLGKALEGLKKMPGGDLIAGAIGGIASGLTQKAMELIADGGRALVEFGKQSIELGSDLQEVQNVVDVTFTSMSADVNQFAKDAAKSAGLSETMAKKYTGTFGAMAKSFGFTEKEAFEMSTTMTQLTGDVASFYNLDHDEAYTKLKSVFTGETEALKDLGVVMTQTALDQYAMEKGIGKLTAEMTEQEKVALRYEFVLDQLESASGDFRRTQEGWENQTRILTLQMDSFMATMGQGLISMLTPAIQLLNDSIPALQTFADEFAAALEPTPADNLRASMESLDKSFADAETQFENTAGELSATVVMAQQCASELEKLQTVGLTTAEAQKKYENVVKRINQLLPNLNLTIDKNTGLLKQNTGEILKNIEALKQQAELKARQECFTEMQEAYEDAAKSVFDAEYDLTVLESERVGYIQQLADEMGTTFERAELLATGYGDMNAELSIADVLYKELIGIYANLNPETDVLIDKIFQNRTAQELLNQEIENAHTKLDEAYVSLEGYSQKLEESVASAEAAAGGQANITEAAQTTVQTVQQLREEYDKAREAARQSIDQQISMFDELNVESEKSAEEIVADSKKTVEAYKNFAKNLQTLVDRGMPSEMAEQFKDFSESSIQRVNELATANQDTLDELIATWENFSEVKGIVAAVIGDINAGTTEALNNVEREFRETYGEIPDVVKQAVDEVNDHIDSLKSATVSVDVTTRYHNQSIGSAYGSSMYNPYSFTGYTVENTSYVPYLAEGAVIPPNAPFTAVLGDQRNGYNLEGPEEMFRSIVREELGSASSEETNELLWGILQAIQSSRVISINGREVFEEMVDENNRAIRMLGKSPLR